MRRTLSSSSLRLALAALLLVTAVGCSSGKPRLFEPILVGAGGSALPQSSRLREIHVPDFLDGRTCWVYLPPGYAPAHGRYPVLYMHDGQELWGPDPPGGSTWHLETSLDSLISGGLVPPLLVVAIKSADRLHEYTPFPYDYGSGAEGGGDEYVRAIIDHLKPAIDRYFPTLTDPDHTMIAGSSLGGLISVYAGYRYDHVFGRIGGFSGSYGWSGRAFWNFVESRRPELSRLYLDSGDGYDNLFQALRMHDVALQQGFVDGQNLLLVIGRDQDHTPRSWGLRFPDALVFLTSGMDLSVP